MPCSKCYGYLPGEITYSEADEPCSCRMSDPDRPTLRDQFAMSALIGILIAKKDEWGEVADEQFSSFAFDLADAMLSERNRWKG